MDLSLYLSVNICVYICKSQLKRMLPLSGFFALLSLLFLINSPVPTISWKRADGKQIPRKARRHKSSSILEIPNFQQEDSGPYECVAENVRGRNVARGQLTFYGIQIIYSPVFHYSWAPKAVSALLCCQRWFFSRNFVLQIGLLSKCNFI